MSKATQTVTVEITQSGGGKKSATTEWTAEEMAGFISYCEQDNIRRATDPFYRPMGVNVVRCPLDNHLYILK